MGKPVEPSEPEEAEILEPDEAGEITSIDTREPVEEEYEEDPMETGWLETTSTDQNCQPSCSSLTFSMKMHPPGSTEPAIDAESILAQRFATGEIDADEYNERRSTLRS